MSLYSKIHRRMWGDAKFCALSAAPPNAQTLWLYLMTGPQCGVIPGLFSIGEAALAEALGWPLKGFREAFAEVFAKGMAEADWKARLVWLPNAPRHNEPASPNVIVGWGRAFDELPECALKVKAFGGLEALSKDLGKAFAEAFRKAFRKPLANQEQEQEQEQEEEEEVEMGSRLALALVTVEPDTTKAKASKPGATKDEAREVFAHWCISMGSTKAVLDDRRDRLIRVAIDRYGVADCKLAIDACRADAWHMGANDRDRKFNSAEYIFRDAERTEKFIGAAREVVARRVAVAAEKARDVAAYEAREQRPAVTRIHPMALALLNATKGTS